MQRVSEFVEHRDHVVEADQCRLARGRLGEVGDVIDDRKRAQQFGLADKVAHPRSAVFVVAFEVVAVPQRQRLAVGVDHFIHLHVGVVDGDVGASLHGDSIKHVRGVKHAVLKHVVDFEVGLCLGLVKIEFCLAHLPGIEVPVPWFESESALLRIDERLNIPRLALGLGG